MTKKLETITVRATNRKEAFKHVRRLTGLHFNHAVPVRAKPIIKDYVVSYYETQRKRRKKK